MARYAPLPSYGRDPHDVGLEASQFPPSEPNGTWPPVVTRLIHDACPNLTERARFQSSGSDRGIPNLRGVHRAPPERDIRLCANRNRQETNSTAGLGSTATLEYDLFFCWSFLGGSIRCLADGSSVLISNLHNRRVHAQTLHTKQREVG